MIIEVSSQDFLKVTRLGSVEKAFDHGGGVGGPMITGSEAGIVSIGGGEGRCEGWLTLLLGLAAVV